MKQKLEFRNGIYINFSNIVTMNTTGSGIEEKDHVTYVKLYNNMLALFLMLTTQNME